MWFRCYLHREKRIYPARKSTVHYRCGVTSPFATIFIANIRCALRGWVSTHLEDLKEASPQRPECLSERQQDGAEPLLAIADAVGGDWPARARAGLTDLYFSSNAEEESVGVILLSDIRDIFLERRAEALASQELAKALAKVERCP